MDKFKILGIAGSLRKGSFNKMLLKQAIALSPGDIDIEYFNLEGIPLFNQDFENDPPEKLKDLKAKIKAADGILIATPEYNYSVPGALKNAIDAASRPYGTNPFEDKVIALMGASIGALGTARAQYHLRQSFVFLNAHVVNRPEIMLPFAEQKFDASGNLTDEKTKELIKELLAELVKLAKQLKKT